MNRNRDIPSRRWNIRPWHIAVVLLCTVMITFGVFRVTRRVRLHNRIEAVRAADYPVTLAELNAWQQAPTGGENAADYVLKVIALLRLPPERDREQIPLLNGSGLPRTEPLDGRTMSAIRRLLDDNTEALDLVQQATRIKYSRYTLDFTRDDSMRTPHFSRFRSTIDLLCLKAVLHGELGELGPAVEAITCAYRLADTLAEEFVLMSHMMRTACHIRPTVTLERILNRTTVDVGHLAHLEQALAATNDPNAMERAFIGQQCLMLDRFRRPMELASIPPSENVPFLHFQMARATGGLDLVKIRCIDLIDRHITAVRLPTPERVRAAEEIGREIRKMRDEHVFLTGVMPDFHGFIISDVTSVAGLLAARTALAIERYRLATGPPPDRLTDLVPRYLEQVPQDPFDGQPLRYRKLERGYVVYSVGRNMSDEGGTKQGSPQAGRSAPVHDAAFIVERAQ